MQLLTEDKLASSFCPLIVTSSIGAPLSAPHEDPLDKGTPSLSSSTGGASSNIHGWTNRRKVSRRGGRHLDLLMFIQHVVSGLKEEGGTVTKGA